MMADSYIPITGATGVAVNTNITVTFNEPVNVAKAFTLECPTGTAIPFTMGAGPATTFTLDPIGDLPAGVTCTVTVVATAVTDVDTVDPPDQMAADYVFSFSTDAAPTVTSTTPVTGAIDVQLDATITITFSESVNATTSSFTPNKSEPVAPGLETGGRKARRAAWRTRTCSLGGAVFGFLLRNSSICGTIVLSVGSRSVDVVRRWLRPDVSPVLRVPTAAQKRPAANVPVWVQWRAIPLACYSRLGQSHPGGPPHP